MGLGVEIKNLTEGYLTVPTSSVLLSSRSGHFGQKMVELIEQTLAILSNTNLGDGGRYGGGHQGTMLPAALMAYWELNLLGQPRHPREGRGGGCNNEYGKEGARVGRCCPKAILVT